MKTTLKQYLKQNKILVKDAAKELNVTRPYLSSIINGAPAGRKLSESIEHWTGGVVKKETVAFPNNCS